MPNGEPGEALPVRPTAVSMVPIVRAIRSHYVMATEPYASDHLRLWGCDGLVLDCYRTSSRYVLQAWRRPWVRTPAWWSWEDTAPEDMPEATIEVATLGDGDAAALLATLTEIAEQCPGWPTERLAAHHGLLAVMGPGAWGLLGAEPPWPYGIPTRASQLMQPEYLRMWMRTGAAIRTPRWAEPVSQ